MSIKYSPLKDETVAVNITDYNASTDTPSLDTTPTGILKGDRYLVTADGTFFDQEVQAGDTLIAKQDDPTLVTHWITTQGNVPLGTAAAKNVGTADGDLVELSGGKLPFKQVTGVSALYQVAPEFDPVKTWKSNLSNSDLTVLGGGYLRNHISLVDACHVTSISMFEFTAGKSGVYVGLVDDTYTYPDAILGYAYSSIGLQTNTGQVRVAGASSYDTTVDATLYEPDGATLAIIAADDVVVMAFTPDNRGVWYGRKNGSTVDWFGLSGQTNVDPTVDSSTPYAQAPIVTTSYYFTVGCFNNNSGDIGTSVLANARTIPAVNAAFGTAAFKAVEDFAEPTHPHVVDDVSDFDAGVSSNADVAASAAILSTTARSVATTAGLTAIPVAAGTTAVVAGEKDIYAEGAGFSDSALITDTGFDLSPLPIARRIKFSPDGTLAYIGEGATDTAIDQTIVTTPFKPELGVGATTTSAIVCPSITRAFVSNRTGTQFAALTDSNDIRFYDMTGGDLTTATFNVGIPNGTLQNKVTWNSGYQITQIDISPDGTKFFIGDSYRIVEIPLTTANDFLSYNAADSELLDIGGTAQWACCYLTDNLMLARGRSREINVYDISSGLASAVLASSAVTTFGISFGAGNRVLTMQYDAGTDRLVASSTGDITPDVYTTILTQPAWEAMGLVKTVDARLSDVRTPTAHAASHTDGTDDIPLATNAQKGLASAAHITALELTGWQLKTADFTAEANGKYIVADKDITVTQSLSIDGEVFELYMRDPVSPDVGSIFIFTYDGASYDTRQYKDSTAYAIAAQGTLADTALQPADVETSFTRSVATAAGLTGFTMGAGTSVVVEDEKDIYAEGAGFSDSALVTDAALDYSGTATARRLKFSHDGTKIYRGVDALDTSIDQILVTTPFKPELGLGTVSTNVLVMPNSTRAFTSNRTGTQFAVVTDLGFIYIYDITDGDLNTAVLNTSIDLDNYTSGITWAITGPDLIDISPDGTRVLIGSFSGQVAEVPLTVANDFASQNAAGTELGTYEGYQAAVCYLTDTLVVYRGNGKQFEVFDISTGLASKVLVSAAVTTYGISFGAGNRYYTLQYDAANDRLLETSTGSLITNHTTILTQPAWEAMGLVKQGDIDTLPELNTLVTDANLAAIAGTDGQIKVTDIKNAYVARTAASAIDAATDYCINCTSGTFTNTLPTAVGIAGQEFIIKNSGAGVITVDTTSSQTIDGALTATLTTQYESITVMSDGANWIIN